MHQRIEADLAPFAPIDPPFNFNAANVSAHPPEVTGYYLLRALRKRLGWQSFEDKQILDMGCGVRLTRTIYNLDIPFGLYVGVDVNAAAIAWLSANVIDPRFRFAHLDARNTLYNPNGRELGASALRDLDLPRIDAVTMFSVITHQTPDEALLTLSQAREVIAPEGLLYFTAFVDDSASGFYEAAPAEPGSMCTYPPQELVDIARHARWRVISIHSQPRTLQQPAFICAPI